MDATKTQIERWYGKLWERITRGDGYQPFGYDWPTMNVTHPHFQSARNRLRQMWLEADQRWAVERALSGCDDVWTNV